MLHVAKNEPRESRFFYLRKPAVIKVSGKATYRISASTSPANIISIKVHTEKSEKFWYKELANATGQLHFG